MKHRSCPLRFLTEQSTAAVKTATICSFSAQKHFCCIDPIDSIPIRRACTHYVVRGSSVIFSTSIFFITQCLDSIPLPFCETKVIAYSYIYLQQENYSRTYSLCQDHQLFTNLPGSEPRLVTRAGLERAKIYESLRRRGESCGIPRACTVEHDLRGGHVSAPWFSWCQLPGIPERAMFSGLFHQTHTGKFTTK